MELLTLAEAKDSIELKSVSGMCSSSRDFLSLLNQAVRKLMNRGSWFGTVQRIRVCSYDCKVVWPRFVGTVLAINLKGTHSTVKNNWYEFLSFSGCDIAINGAFPFINGSFSSPTTSDGGLQSVFNPIACSHPVYVRVYPSVRADVGKRVTIYGVDHNSIPVRTKISSTEWQDGETVPLAIPYVQTTTLFRSVDRISKPVTQGIVRYYQFQPVGEYTYDLVQHDPTETTPVYRSSKIPSGAGCCLKSIDALVKLDFIPVVADSDIVQISNLDAIALMMSAIRNSNAGNKQEALSEEADAVRELNLELRNKFGNSQTVTRVNLNAHMPRAII